MISSLRGIVQAVGEGSLVLEVGGVGLSVAVPT
ncbi:MAG: OB-fold domain-containing protein, partial [Chloroflexota bacterium]